MELTPSERIALDTAQRRVGIVPGETPTRMQAHLAAGIAREAIETARPIGKSGPAPTITKSATKAADRITKLEEVRDTPSFSPSMRRFASRELKAIALGKDIDAAEQSIVKSLLDELEESHEQTKILARLYETAADDPTRRAVKAAQMRHFDASTATVTEIQTRHLRKVQ